jgi:hypothetical protein
VLYAQWRYRGISPWEAYHGRPPAAGEPVWPSRLEALLSSFAWEAAERERDVADLKEILGEMFGGEEDT